MAQVGCRRSVACLSFRSMTDLGYYYSPMAGDHLTITGHTGAPAGFQMIFLILHLRKNGDAHLIKRTSKIFQLDNRFVSIGKNAKVGVSTKMLQQNLKLFEKSCLNATEMIEQILVAENEKKFKYPKVVIVYLLT
ncbi:hypothetical protein T07_1737 [Trichinella nelsoni]|uniref:Uncharacterized protein n=1 Tax=Trichinella nelsoni TaxID=6336 RepID=A0A0V0S552_9BILA|nr:hypothetical protein T07_1737 [Trichinella nelsoni]